MKHLMLNHARQKPLHRRRSSSMDLHDETTHTHRLLSCVLRLFEFWYTCCRVYRAFVIQKITIRSKRGFILFY